MITPARTNRTVPADDAPKPRAAVAPRRSISKEAKLTSEKQPVEPKILVIDIETSPLEVWLWGLWKQDYISADFVKIEWSILSYAAKWVGRKEIFFGHTGGRGAERVRDDGALLEPIQRLMSQADIVVAQNGRKFDVRKINWRLAEEHYTPYAPTRVIDTLIESRKVYAATSHKLAWLSEHLTDSPKDDHKKFPGFELWQECLKDNPLAWAYMRRYNVQDIRATEKLYLRLRPWIKTHPNIAVYMDSDAMLCPRCGSTNLIEAGRSATQASTYKRYQCGACGGWARGKTMQLALEKRRSLLIPE